MQLLRGEDTIEYTFDIDGEDREFEIAYSMDDDCDEYDRPIRIVEYWRVVKVDGKPNMLGEFWREQLNEEFVVDAIFEQEAE